MLQLATQALDAAEEDEGSVSGASRLSAQERIFCDTFVANGGKGTEAALAAGYSANGAHVQALRLLCRKRVADYLMHLSQRFIHSAIPIAIRTLIEIAADPEALRKDRIKAATCLLEHGGMAAPKGGVQVNVGVQVNGQQAQALIGEVWEAKQRRLSDIPPAMPDTLQEDLRDIEAMALPAPADPPGGSSFQGPVSGSGPVPVHPTAGTPKTTISCECPLCRDKPAGEDEGWEGFDAED